MVRFWPVRWRVANHWERDCGDLGLHGIQGQVEVEDVDPWIAEESERASLGVLCDQCLNLCDAQAARGGDATDLFLCVGGAEVGDAAGPAGEQRVWGDLGRVDAVEGGGGGPAVLDGGDQVFVLRAEVGCTAGRWVVSQPSRGRPALEVLWVCLDDGVALGVFGWLAVLQDGTGEPLPDEGGADGLAAANYEGAVGVVAEGDLRKAGHGQRVGQAQDDGEQEQGPQRGAMLPQGRGDSSCHGLSACLF